MTADYARKLTNEYSPLKYKKLKDVYEYIQMQALHGFNSVFIDGDVVNLKKFQKSLKQKGYKAFLDGNLKETYLTVEW